jgi:hypothetical protein
VSDYTTASGLYLLTPDSEVIEHLSHAGAATEPLVEFDPVAYRRARRRVERARFRRSLLQAFGLGVAVGIVLFSVAVEVLS